MVAQYLVCSKGVGSIQRNLYWPHLKRVATLVPPAPEQKAIISFLGHADRHIHRYIRAKQKLIKLLEERKQVTIHRAVTRGLDPNVPLKPTGLEWLPEVPEHWELVPNRALLRLEKRIVGSAWADYVLLSLTKRGVIPRDMENPEGKFPTSFETYQEVRPGDLIFCLFDIDETPRAVGLSNLHGMVTGAYTVVDWVHLFYLAMDNGKRLKPLYTGLRKVITRSAFLSAKLPLPPPAEQATILTHVEESTTAAERTTERVQREIDLLRELRTRLIADVVTGKLDVREAVARLPDEADDVEPFEDLEELAEGNEDAASDPDNEEAEA
jgi:type I restriction enzyme S subunit